MSIRMLAIEYYRAKRRTEELEKELEGLPSGSAKRKELEEELRKALAEESHLKAMLEGAKA